MESPGVEIEEEELISNEPRRSGRVITPLDCLTYTHNPLSYTHSQVGMLAEIVHHALCFAQSYTFRKGIEVFGKRRSNAVVKEVSQLHK